MSIFDHLSETEAQRLWVNGAAWAGFIADGDYVPQQANRFETTNTGDDPTEARWLNAFATWHDTTADALLYLAYVRSQGAEAILLYDVAALDADPTFNGDVVVTLGYEPDTQWLQHIEKHPEVVESSDLSIQIPEDPSVIIEGNRRLQHDDGTPEGMWTGWALDEETGVWNTALQNDYHDALGWHARAMVHPLEDGEFGLNVEVVYVIKHVHNVDVHSQPHSVHEQWNHVMGADSTVEHPLAEVQRFATTWATLTMETFEILAHSSAKIIDRRAPALREQVMQRLTEIFNEGD